LKKDLYRTSLILGERVFYIIVNFGLFTLLTRHLGPEDFGRLVYTLAIFRIFETVAQFGVNTLFQKVLRRDPCLENYKTALKVRLYSSYTAVLGLCLISFFYAEGEIRMILLCFIIPLSIKPLNLHEAFLLTWFKHQWVAGSKLMVTILVATLQTIAILNGAGLTTIVLIFVFEATIRPILFWLVAKHLDLTTELSKNKSTHPLQLRAIIPLALTAFVGILFNRQDMLFIEHYLPAAALGAYALGVRLQTVFMNLPTSLISVFYPRLLALEESPKRFDQVAIQTGVLLVYPAIVFSLIVSLFSEQVITILGGTEFLEVSYHLGIYIWALPFYSLTVIQARLNLMRNQESQNFVNALVSLGLTSLLYFIFVQRIGLEGIALGYLITRFTSTIIIPIVIPKQRFFLRYAFSILFPVSVAKSLIAKAI
jgi:O-antigen/teichoic acid export membrane protein